MPDRLFYSIIFGFIGGVLIRSLLLVPNNFLILVLCASVLFVLVSFVGKRHRDIFLLLSIFSISIFLGVLRFSSYEEKNLDKSLDKYIGKQVEIVGVVSDEPDRREKNQKLLVSITEIDGLDIHSDVLVTTDLYPEFSYGDEVSVSGKLDVPKNFATDQGKIFDYVSYLGKDNIFYLIQRGSVEFLSHDIRPRIQEQLFNFKNRIVDNISDVIPEPESTFMSGITLGARSGLPASLRDDFVTTGTIHIVALSGYNISVVANGIQKFCALFLGRFTALGLGGVSIIIFVLMTGAQSTAVRAGIMAILVVLARSTGRTYDISRALALAGFLMIFINPKVLVFDISFQLSFLATLGIVYLTPITEKWLSFMRSKKLSFLKEIISTTLAAQITVLPFIVYTMGNLSLISFPINILILPFIPIAMYLGFVVGFLGFIGAWISFPFGFVSTLLLKAILWVIETSAKLPFASIYVRNFPIWFLILIYATLIFWVYKWHSKRSLI